VSALGRTERLVIAIVAVFTVLAGIGHYAGWASIPTFVFATIALAGLAHVVATGVESVGERLGPGIAGFMQASLGNLPELFLVIFALKQGEAIVAQSTVIGSIFSNALLVLGIVIVVGSRKSPDGVMRFRHRLPNDTATLLIATTFIIVIVGLSLQTHDPASTHVNTVSTIAAIGLLIVYLFWVVPYIRSGEEPGDEGITAGETTHRPDMLVTERRVARAEPHESGGVAVAEAQRVMTGADDVEEDEHEAGLERHIPLRVGITLLAVGGVGAAFVSDWFVHALTPTIDKIGFSQAFAGLVIVAIAGNAIENVVGIQLAARGHADYALSVIINSPLQIALVLAPALVLLSLFTATTLTLVFAPMLVAAVVVTVLIVSLIVFDGESNWLEGATLIGLYAIIAASFWWG
jgi:Ca2+:H+ antiporter